MSGSRAMLRERYEPMDVFVLVPQLGAEPDSILTQLHLLDDAFVQYVKADLARRYQQTT